MKASVLICKAIGVGLLGLAPTLAPAQSLKVFLLGTGNPQPRIERFSAGILVEAGARKMLFDSGRSESTRLNSSHIQKSRMPSSA